MSLISRYLEKMGIKDPSKDLSFEEKTTLENWRRILSEGELTLDKVKEFCDFHIALIEGQFRDPTKSDREKANLTLVHSVYGALRTLIVSPVAQREALEKYLTSLLNQEGGQRT